MRLIISSRAAGVLVAGLLATQALVITHGFAHPILADAGYHCAICVHGTVGDDIPPAPGRVDIPPLRSTSCPDWVWFARAPNFTFCGYRSRGPPLISC